MDKKHYFYVLECCDNSLYAGYTTDITKRVATHNSGKGAKYTRAKRPVELVYFEAFDSKNVAMRAEAQFKKLTRKKKLEKINEKPKKLSE